MNPEVSERIDGVLTRVAREMVSLRLTAEDRALLKALALEQTKRAGGLRAVTVTDVVRWAIRLGAKELGIAVEALAVEPVKNGAPRAKEKPPEPAPIAEDEPDAVASVLAGVESTTSAVESTPGDQPAPTGSQEPVKNAPLPDELEDMLKGV